MPHVLQLSTRAGDSIYVELQHNEQQEELVSSGFVVTQSQRALESVFATIRPVAESALTALKDLSPHQFTIAFGMRVTVEGNVLFTKSSAEGTFTVSVTWNKADAGDGQ